MQPHVTQALHDWYAAWTVHERAAQAAFSAAFPALEHSDTRCHCLGPTLRWDRPGEGQGRACLDDHGRATIDFDGLPKQALGQALTKFRGNDWFDEGPDGFAQAEPGTYHYEDELTYSEYEITVHADDTASVYISYEKVDDIVVFLDLLENALAAQRVT
jgi:hypothetical protein